MNKIAPIVTLVRIVGAHLVRAWLCGAFGLGLGAWWGLHQATPGAAPVAAVHPVMRLMAAPNVSDPLAGIDMSALRAMLREELAAALGGNQGANRGGNQGVKPASVPAPPSPETLAKRREAQIDIDTLIAGGVWGNEQRFNFQQRIGLLDPEQREHAMRELVTSLNNGTLKVETDGSPL